MSTQLRRVRAYLLKIEHLFYRLTTVLAIVFAVFAIYQAYHTVTLGGTFSSFFDDLFTPTWSWIWGMVACLVATFGIARIFTKKSD